MTSGDKKGSDSNTILSTKVVEKIRKETKTSNIPEAVFGVYIPQSHVHTSSATMADISDDTSKRTEKLFLRDLDYCIATTASLTASIKKYKATEDYAQAVAFCRFLPITHFTIESHFGTNTNLSSPKSRSVPVCDGFLIQLHLLKSRFDLREPKVKPAMESPNVKTAEKIIPPSSSSSLTAVDSHKSSKECTLFETLSSERRVTSRNVIKWIQQLLTSMLVVHCNYMSVGDITLSDVILESDAYVVSALQEHRSIVNARNKAFNESRENGSDQEENGDDQVFFQKIQHDTDRNAWIDLHGKLFVSEQQKQPHQPGSRASSPAKPTGISIDTRHTSPNKESRGLPQVTGHSPFVRVPSNRFDRSLLLQYDAKKTGHCFIQ